MSDIQICLILESSVGFDSDVAHTGTIENSPVVSSPLLDYSVNLSVNFVSKIDRAKKTQNWCAVVLS